MPMMNNIRSGWDSSNGKFKGYDDLGQFMTLQY